MRAHFDYGDGDGGNMSIELTRWFSVSIVRRASWAVVLVGVSGPLAQSAELDLETTYFRDDRATALVILRNDDEPHGYATVGVECVFELSGRQVGASKAEISDLRYRQHTAARLSTPVEGDRFDHASCHITDAKIR
jgi:hypothetical protein